MSETSELLSVLALTVVFVVWFSAPADVKLWTPEAGFSISPNLEGKARDIGEFDSPVMIEQQTGMASLSMQAYSSKFNGEPVKITGRNDGQVMYENAQGFFVLLNTNPTRWKMLTIKDVVQKDGEVFVRYERNWGRVTFFYFGYAMFAALGLISYWLWKNAKESEAIDQYYGRTTWIR